MLRPARYCWPSSRVMFRLNGEKAPAAMFWLPAEKPRLNGVGPQAPPAPSESTVKLELGVDASRTYGSDAAAYGVIELVVVAVPHASGFASVALGPPFR